MAQPQVPEVPRLPVRPPAEDFDVSQRPDVASSASTRSGWAAFCS